MSARMTGSNCGRCSRLDRSWAMDVSARSRWCGCSRRTSAGRSVQSRRTTRASRRSAPRVRWKFGFVEIRLSRIRISAGWNGYVRAISRAHPVPITLSGRSRPVANAELLAAAYSWPTGSAAVLGLGSKRRRARILGRSAYSLGGSTSSLRAINERASSIALRTSVVSSPNASVS